MDRFPWAKSVKRGVWIAALLLALCACGKPAEREIEWAMRCQENLIRIDAAVDIWAVDNDKGDGTTVSLSALAPREPILMETPTCPGGGHYPKVLTVGGESPTCDYQPPKWFDTQGDKYKHKIPSPK